LEHQVSFKDERDCVIARDIDEDPGKTDANNSRMRKSFKYLAKLDAESDVSIDSN